jgi:wyosine [tRNA(Phe)-imidazoG37] synthetase (radical SAM superfamily)
VEGLIKFGRSFAGKLWLEVFLLGGSTGIASEVEKIAALVRQMRVDRVQLNTVARPPAESFALPLPEDEMTRLAGVFGEKAEVVADFRGVHQETDFAVEREDVLSMLKRRPCTLEDVSAGLGIHRNEAVKYLDHLAERGEIRTEVQDGKCFYVSAGS